MAVNKLTKRGRFLLKNKMVAWLIKNYFACFISPEVLPLPPPPDTQGLKSRS
jgi:hypothetical protein